MLYLCNTLMFKNYFSTLNSNFRLFNVAKFTPDPCLFFQANQKGGTDFICSVLSGTWSNNCSILFRH